MSKALTILTALFLMLGSTAWGYTPNDPLYGEQWAFSALGLESAWDYNQGGSSAVKVAVIDSGTAWSVEDLSGTNFDRGAAWDYIDGDSDPGNDGYGHGTFITSIIAGTTDNGVGGAGVAANSAILPLRVADDAGNLASNQTLADAINYAVDSGADIINLSFGQPPYSSDGGWAYDSIAELEAACQRAKDSGVLVVAAAGNSAIDAVDQPAAYSTVLAVGSVNSDLSRAGYSSHANTMVVAPGTDILQETSNGDYIRMSGTSMASAFVSGVASLLLAEGFDTGAAPGKDSSRVDWLVNVLTSTTQDLGDAGQDTEYGYGLIRADSALSSIQ